MKTFRIFVGLLVVISLPIAAQKASTLDELLQNVEQGMTQDASDNQKRENEFRQKRGQQEALLSESTATKVKEEERSAKLENVFEDNEKELNELTETLNERLGALKELFGVMQQVAGDARSRFDISLTNVQFPNRGDKINRIKKEKTK
jgi:biopolymer transport protein ExbB